MSNFLAAPVTSLKVNYWLIGGIVIYALIWTFAPALLSSSVALDVSEGVNWGREWQWGYYKHPPLSSWVLYGFYHAFGDVGIYALSQLCVFGSMAFIYQLGRQFFSKNLALLGALALLLVGYNGYPTLEFNHNIAQLPIWAGLLYGFYMATYSKTGLTLKAKIASEPTQATPITQKSPYTKWRYWLLVGVLGGLGMLTKYHVAFLLVSMALYLLLPANRYWLKSPKPWVAMAIMLAIFSPHLWWLAHHHWLPFSYAAARTTTSNAWAGHFSWVGFLFTQALMHLPLILAVGWASGLGFTQNIKKLGENIVQVFTKNSPVNALWERKTTHPQFYLIYMTAVPVIILMGCSLLLGLGLRDMWGTPMWELSGLLAMGWLVKRVADNKWQAVQSRLYQSLMIWLSLLTAIMLVMVGGSDAFSAKPSRMQYPQAAIATNTAMTWQQVSSCPLDSLTGDRWYTALAAMRLPEFPSLLIGGSLPISPWITPARLHEHGTLVIQASPSSDKMGELAPADLPALTHLLDTDPNLQRFTGNWSIPWRVGTSAKKPPLQLQWTAYVPMACVKSLK